MGIIDGIKNTAVNAKWEIQARAEVIAADKDGNGKLNDEEFRSLSFYPEDNFIANHARSFEFGAIDELKVADGQISGSELANYYKAVDGDKNGKLNEDDLPSIDRFMSKSSGLHQIFHPLPAAATWFGVAAHAIGQALTQSGNK